MLVRGSVGDGPGVEFLSWMTEMDLPDPEAVLANPDAFVSRSDLQPGHRTPYGLAYAPDGKLLGEIALPGLG